MYYHITHVVMDKDTSDEDVSLLHDMIIQNNSAYLKSLTIRNKDLVLPSQKQSQLRHLNLGNLVLSHDNVVQLCTSLSSLSRLGELRLTDLSCSDDDGSCCLSVLDLHRHHKLETLMLDKISISGLILPSQEQSQLCKLYLDNLVLSHDNLVQLCKLSSSLSSLQDLRLTNLSCSDDGGRCRLPVLNLHYHKLKWLKLNKISISGLVLPSQNYQYIFGPNLYLDNLVLSHDTLVQLCTSLSSWSSLKLLILTNLSCSDDGRRCRLSVLDLHRHHSLRELKLDKISISGLILPRQDQLQLWYLYLDNLVLSHDNLVQFCTSLPSLSTGKIQKLDNLTCSDHSSISCTAIQDIYKWKKSA